LEEKLNLKDIRSLLEMLQKHEVREFKLERNEEKIWLKRGAQQLDLDQQPPAQAPIQQVFGSMPLGGQVQQPIQAQESTNVAPPALAAAAPATEAESRVSAADTATKITSPMVGTFYRRPAVDAEPYVEVGDKVKKGDVLCIVEAMKLMNEIEAEVSGTVVEVCLEDGQMVEYGEVLFKVELS
jgi:acetyl-CoA carboxylase biotin carboxyl carrier protein